MIISKLIDIIIMQSVCITTALGYLLCLLCCFIMIPCIIAWTNINFIISKRNNYCNLRHDYFFSLWTYFAQILNIGVDLDGIYTKVREPYFAQSMRVVSRTIRGLLRSTWDCVNKFLKTSWRECEHHNALDKYLLWLLGNQVIVNKKSQNVFY